MLLEAQDAAEKLLARVRLGIYKTRTELELERAEREAERDVAPLFAPFAEEWFERRCDLGGRAGNGLSPAGRADYRNQLDQHLLPWFAGLRLDQIDVQEVERYASAKRREGRIGPTYLNKTLSTLRAIFRDAVRYGRLPRNPAEGVRVASARFTGSWLDSADQITALLDAARELDRAGRFREGPGRALLATLTFAGLRLDEALSLRWDDVNLATCKLHVRGTKTDAADRMVDLLVPLRDELSALKARRRPDRTELVFATSTGRKLGASNVRRRILTPAVDRANERLLEIGADRIRGRITPHSLRRTFASLLVALGRDMRVAMTQLGHSDPHLTLRVYAREMSSSENHRERLRALVEGTAAPVPASAPAILEAA